MSMHTNTYQQLLNQYPLLIQQGEQSTNLPTGSLNRSISHPAYQIRSANWTKNNTTAMYKYSSADVPNSSLKTLYNPYIYDNYESNINYQPQFRYAITSRIGKGTFGDIWSATDLLTHKKYAIKTIRPSRLTGIDEIKKKNYERIFMYEANRMINLHKIKTEEIGKKYVLNCIDYLYFDTNKQTKKKSNNSIINLINGRLMNGPCLVIDLCDHSLLHYILYNQRNNKKILISTIRHISLQLFSAMSFIHGIGNCLHSDIKPENLLIKYENNNYDLPNIKLADFGNALLFNTKLKTFNLQTLWYRAPEVLFGNRESISSLIDMWSIGCILYELFLFNGHRIFKCNEGFNPIYVVNKINYKISKFPIYMYNKYASNCYNKYNTSFTNNISYMNLKNKRKSQIIQNLINSKTIVNTFCFNNEFLHFIDLLACLLDVNPLTRYTSQDSINHKFITGVLDSSFKIDNKWIKCSNDNQRQHRINNQVIKYKKLLNKKFSPITSQKKGVVLRQNLY